MKKHLLLKLLFFSLISLVTVKSYSQSKSNYTQAHNWTIASPASTTMVEDGTIINEGSKSAKVTWNNIAVQDINSDSFSVTANSSYSYSVDIYDNDNAGKVLIAVLFDDATYQYSAYSTRVNDQANWQTITITGAVSATATSAYVQIRFDNNTEGFWVGQATIYVDNARYTEDGGSNLITNYSFETWEIIDPDPPVWTSGYPITANIASTSLDLIANTNEEGTAYYVVLTDGATAPTTIEVKNGTGSGGTGVEAFGSISITGIVTDFTENISGLTHSTAYDIYVVAEDDELSPNIQTSAALVEFTTLPPTAEPTNHVTSFTATANSYNSIDLAWTDAAKVTLFPDAYLIKASTGIISAPVDGIDPSEDNDLSDGEAVVKVLHNGTQEYSFIGLNAATTYNFKIWPYTNDGELIDYKLDGVIPEANVATASSELFFSEYIEGGTGNTALEIYNPTENPVNLSNYKILGNVDGSDWVANNSFVLPDIELAAGGIYVICRADADQTILDQADLTYTDGPSYEMSFTGNDARALAITNDGGTTWNVIDIIGDKDVNPGTGWNVAETTTATANHSLIRKTERTFGNDDWTGSAGTTTINSEWIVMPLDYFNNLGAYRSINTDATLSALTFDDTSVEGFTSGTYNYNEELALDSSVPNVDGTATDAAYAKVSIVQAQNLTGTEAERTATVKVTADDLSTQDYTIIFTVALNTDATVTSTVYNVNSTALTITDIPAGTTLAEFESNLIPATGATFETYLTDGITLATDLATDYKLIVTAEDGITKKTYTITILTGTNSIINNLDIKLYPNPSKGLFKLELSNSNNEEFSVNIYDVIGKIVYSSKITNNISIIDLSEIDKGIYYVSIKKENNRKVTKIIIH